MSDTDRPMNAEAVFTLLLRSNTEDLTRNDTRLREARELVEREEAERVRLHTVREGLQAGRQAVLAGQRAQPSPSA